MSRHLFLQHLSDGTLHQLDRRAGEAAIDGRVLEAAYLEKRDGLLDSLARWLTGREALALTPPFGEEFVRSIPLPALPPSGYRASAAKRAIRVGDAPGTRLVLRVLSR